MKLKSLLLITALSLSTLGFANPSDKSLDDLAKLANYEALFYRSVADSLENDGMALAYALSNNSKLTDDERKKAMESYNSYAEGLLKSLDTPQVKASLKKTYLQTAKSIYNQKEVDVQLAFYGSTDGQNALKKQGAMTSSYLQSAQDANKSVLEAYGKQSEKTLQEIEKIVKKK